MQKNSDIRYYATTLLGVGIITLAVGLVVLLMVLALLALPLILAPLHFALRLDGRKGFVVKNGSVITSLEVGPKSFKKI